LNQRHKYDYIIGGAGLAGLTLAWQLLKGGLLEDKNLLLIDADDKKLNDRTWSFWSEPKKWLLDLPISQTWSKAVVKGKDFNSSQALNPYRYYKIEGLDFYQFIFKELSKSSQVTFIQDIITSEDANERTVITKKSKFHYQSYFFKSYFLADELSKLKSPKKHFIWQHFMGWKIKSPKAIFKEDEVTYMDMQVAEVDAGLSFAYILPESETVALVEYTLFSAELWNQEDYESALKNYIKNNLGITEYEILEEEFNKIPMTTSSFASRNKGIIPIGTLAGTVKPSTGYSFVRNYKHIQLIIKTLKDKTDDFRLSQSRRFQFYDEVLINVLHERKSTGHTVFGMLYKRNKLPQLLKFLNEDTNLWEEIKIMNTVPKSAFMKAVWEEIFK
jgi:lycopene beta-cyclase